MSLKPNDIIIVLPFIVFILLALLLQLLNLNNTDFTAGPGGSKVL